MLNTTQYMLNILCVLHFICFFVAISSLVIIIVQSNRNTTEKNSQMDQICRATPMYIKWSIVDDTVNHLILFFSFYFFFSFPLAVRCLTQFHKKASRQIVCLLWFIIIMILLHCAVPGSLLMWLLVDDDVDDI